MLLRLGNRGHWQPVTLENPIDRDGRRDGFRTLRRKAGRTEKEERVRKGHTESDQEADATGQRDAAVLAGFLLAATNANWAGKRTVLPDALAGKRDFQIKSDSGK